MTALLQITNLLLSVQYAGFGKSVNILDEVVKF